MTLPMSADHLLAENVRALLAADPRSQSDLAQWCRHSSVWVSQFLTGKRKWKVEDLDRVADFFNLSTFQLFQPGIANSNTERRIGQRRQREERRRTQSERELRKTQAELARVGMPGHRERSEHLAGGRAKIVLAASSESMHQLHEIVAAFVNRQLAPWLRENDARRQAPVARLALPKGARRRRGRDGPTASSAPAVKGGKR